VDWDLLVHLLFTESSSRDFFSSPETLVPQMRLILGFKAAPEIIKPPIVKEEID